MGRRRKLKLINIYFWHTGKPTHIHTYIVYWYRYICLFNYCNLLVDFCANEPRDVQLKFSNKSRGVALAVTGKRDVHEVGVACVCVCVWSHIAHISIIIIIIRRGRTF